MTGERLSGSLTELHQYGYHPKKEEMTQALNEMLREKNRNSPLDPGFGSFEPRGINERNYRASRFVREMGF